jgi:hypothetical protein
MSSKRLLFRLGFFYLRLIGFFCRLLPRRLALWLSILVGNLYWAVMKKDREMVKRNLRQILENPSEAGKIARRTFIRYAQYLVDYTRMDLIRQDNLERLVNVSMGRSKRGTFQHRWAAAPYRYLRLTLRLIPSDRLLTRMRMSSLVSLPAGLSISSLGVFQTVR